MSDPIKARACPYCHINFSIDGVNAEDTHLRFGRPRPGPGRLPATDYVPEKSFITLDLISHLCPSCKGQIIWINEIENVLSGPQYIANVISSRLLWPKHPVCQVPTDVPEPLASDFREAHDTLPISAKASAALSRRCLQMIIRDQEGFGDHNLIDQVKKLLARNKIPAHLADDLDAIRNIGNFAAHPQKDQNTGEIADVEPGEAEWTLQVLEDLLTFYFVDLPKSAERRKALNQKLSDAGHKPMLSS
jgi:Domain of unknown function (DUF4145)